MKLQRRLQIFISLFITLIFTSACSNLATRSLSKNTVVQKIDLLVSTQWLSEHLNAPDLIVLDTTVIIKSDEKGNYISYSGRTNYEAEHIPSAGFADLIEDLSGGDGSLQFIMPTPNQFSKAIAALGVGNDSRVVLYSAKNPVWAARLWWMLRWAGFDQVAILDGGLQAWKAEGRALSTEPQSHPRKQFSFALRSEVIAEHAEVLAAINNNQTNIIDALPEAHYQGQFSLYSRLGHITSATNMPTSNLLESSYYKSYDELDMMHDGDRSKRTITYCGGGVAAASLAFTMFRLGYTDVAVYMGSLQEWVTNPENPMTVEAPE